MRDKLAAHGYSVRQIAQEHSYVADMWQRLTNPDLLCFLDVSYEESLRRRKLNWTQADYDEQQRRLRHARTHADLYIQTDSLTADEALASVLAFLDERGISVTN